MCMLQCVWGDCLQCLPLTAPLPRPLPARPRGTRGLGLFAWRDRLGQLEGREWWVCGQHLLFSRAFLIDQVAISDSSRHEQQDDSDADSFAVIC